MIQFHQNISGNLIQTENYHITLRVVPAQDIQYKDINNLLNHFI